MGQENNNPGKERNVRQYLLLGGLLVIVLLVGFSNLFGSTLTREEIRATAFVIVANRLTQDAEVRLPPTATITLNPSQPARTPEPRDCPPEKFSSWKDITIADIEILETEFEVIKSGNFTADELIDIQARALAQENTLPTTDYPSCVKWVQQRLRSVYSQFALTVQAVIDDDMVAF